MLQWNKHTRWLHYGVLPPSDLKFFLGLFPVGLSETTDLDSPVLRGDAVAASGSVTSSQVCYTCSWVRRDRTLMVAKASYLS